MLSLGTPNLAIGPDKHFWVTQRRGNRGLGEFVLEELLVFSSRVEELSKLRAGSLQESNIALALRLMGV